MAHSQKLGVIKSPVVQVAIVVSNYRCFSDKPKKKYRCYRVFVINIDPLLLCYLDRFVVKYVSV